MDCLVHGVAKSQTQLNNFHFTHFKFTYASLHISLCIYIYLLIEEIWPRFYLFTLLCCLVAKLCLTLPCPPSQPRGNYHYNWFNLNFFSFIFISWKLITLQYYSGFCHMLTWISHGFTCVPHPDTLSHLPPHPIPLDLPSAPALSPCLMHPTWAGDLFHPWQYTCFNAVLSEHPTLAFSHRVPKSVLYIYVSFSVLHIGLSLPSF